MIKIVCYFGVNDLKIEKNWFNDVNWSKLIHMSMHFYGKWNKNYLKKTDISSETGNYIPNECLVIILNYERKLG